jgi:predicted Zn-dependent protease
MHAGRSGKGKSRLETHAGTSRFLVFGALPNTNLPPMNASLRCLFGFLVVCWLVGCSTVPETGRRQLVMMSPQEEARQANLTFQQIKRQAKVSQNQSMNTRVRTIGQRIVHVAPVQKTGWEFVLFEDPEPNAFALPGGKIGIHTGMFKVATDDGMLATVIAHEVAHVVARHGAERVSQGMLAGIGGLLLDVGLAVGTDMSPGARRTILGAYGAGATLGVILPYSRTMEYEADKLGLLYMARAGYNPQSALRFWKNMVAYGEKNRRGRELPPFLRTHPVDEARIAQIERLMPMAMEEYRAATSRQR